MLPNSRVAVSIYCHSELNPEIFVWCLLEPLKIDFEFGTEVIQLLKVLIGHSMQVVLKLHKQKTQQKARKGSGVSGRGDSMCFELVPEKSGK